MNIQGNVIENMYKLRLYKDLVYFMLLFQLVIGKKCNIYDLVHPQCSDTQLCDEKTGTCQCKPGFEAHNDTFCVDVNPQNTHTSTPNTSSLVASHNSGSIVAGILIPLFLILFVIYALYVGRKYKVVHWFRRKIYLRNNNNHDEFMIGQDQEDDDPPLH